MNKVEQWFNNVCAFQGDVAEYEQCHSDLTFCEECGIVHTEKFPCPNEPDATIDTGGESNADTETLEAT